ncbi:hypothetical protein NPIL_423901 [Nephila pilipes]|uniref:Uncharacterized protein n=1 Tax=Nephila pilipes TaxID=299642 RepID=A0A8X6P5Y2_NEPPI|nr:hypothetical protein NPIL_423901 [Nephila pilipes]
MHIFKWINFLILLKRHLIFPNAYLRCIILAHRSRENGFISSAIPVRVKTTQQQSKNLLSYSELNYKVSLTVRERSESFPTRPDPSQTRETSDTFVYKHSKRGHLDLIPP